GLEGQRAGRGVILDVTGGFEDRLGELQLIGVMPEVTDMRDAGEAPEDEDIVAGAAEEVVVAGTGDDGIVAGAGVNRVVAAAADDEVAEIGGQRLAGHRMRGIDQM